MEQLHAFVLFALVAGFTPGPNNLMLATSGVNHGLKRTLPYMLGVSGPRGQFIARPWLQTGLQIAGSLYLAWPAWKIALAPAVQGAAEAGRPLSFLQAAAFQWINPKEPLINSEAPPRYGRRDIFQSHKRLKNEGIWKPGFQIPF